LDEKGELGRVLDRFGVRRDVLNTLLAAQGEEEAGCEVPPYWSQILSDTISCDILDYLQRDAYFTGLRISVDPRVSNYFRIDRKSGNLYIDLTKRELLREDILSEVVRLLEARYYFSERVYYHHAKVAAGALMARAIELACQADLVGEEDFYDQTDASVVDLLERRSERAEAATKKRIRHLMSCLRTRRLPKRVCVFPRYANAEIQEELVERNFTPGAHKERAALEERVMDLIRFGTGRETEFLVYCPSARMQLKEAETHVLWPGEKEIKPLSEYSEHVPRLADLERSYRDLWKFYCFADTTEPELLKQIQEIAVAEFPGATNVYRIDEAPRLGE
jgi:HD superfamily phosphohydrolase